MCEVATIMTVASLAGTAASMYGAQQQGINAQRIANYNANAKRQQAEAVMQDSVLAEEQQATRTKQILGAQTARMGGTGLEMGTGTLGAIGSETVQMGRQDLETIHLNAQRQAWGLTTAASNDELQGQTEAANGRNSAWGSLISGGARAYGTYLQYSGWTPKPKGKGGSPSGASNMAGLSGWSGYD